MIWNLIEYLVTQHPSFPFTVNGFSPEERKEEIVLNETGGNVAHWYDRNDFTVQIIARFNSVVEGREQMFDVYTTLLNRFNLELPEKTVNSVVYPALQTYQISPVQSPAYLGQDSEGMARFSFNIVVTI